MTLTTFQDVPRGVLARLLDLTGRPAQMSPRRLMGAPSQIDPYQVAQLFGGGYLADTRIAEDALTPAFRQAAEVVRNPRTNLTVRIWGEDDVCGETSMLFPGDIAEGGGVLLTPIRRHYRMAAFVEPQDIISLVGPMLPVDAPPRPAPFDFAAHLEAAVAAVLFALADLTRGRGLEGGRTSFSAHEISGYLAGRWCLTGFDDLTTYAQSVGMQSRPPAILEVEHALEKLSAAKAIRQVAGARYTLSPELMPLVELTRGTLSGLQWQRLSRLDDGATLIVDRTFVYGEEGLILQMSPTVDAQIHIASTPQQAVTDFVIDEISGHVGRPEPAGRAEAPPKPAKRQPAARAPDAATCPACGAALKTGAKFCAACGARIGEAGATQRTPRRTCASCGHALAPDAKFCAHCGAKAGTR
jgi:hypothetical protein